MASVVSFSARVVKHRACVIAVAVAAYWCPTAAHAYTGSSIYSQKRTFMKESRAKRTAWTSEQPLPTRAFHCKLVTSQYVSTRSATHETFSEGRFRHTHRTTSILDRSHVLD
jgi:hypothetical protein